MKRGWLINVEEGETANIAVSARTGKLSANTKVNQCRLVKVYCKQSGLNRANPSEAYGEIIEPTDESPNSKYLDGAESGDSV